MDREQFGAAPVQPRRRVPRRRPVLRPLADLHDGGRVDRLHPTLPLLAIGLDNGDEYDRKGGLTLLECDTGHRVDFADPAWGIEPVRWLDDHTLELNFFTMDNEGAPDCPGDGRTGELAQPPPMPST